MVAKGKSRQLKLGAAHGHQSKGRGTGGAQEGRRKNAEQLNCGMRIGKDGTARLPIAVDADDPARRRAALA